MNSSPTQPSVADPPRRPWRLSAILCAAIVLAYANTFTVPFVFDDVAAVTRNPSLASFVSALFPPPGLSVSGRPLVNLSLALNHFLSGESVWSYHALNLGLHVLNALLLFTVLRTTFRLLAPASPTSPRPTTAPPPAPDPDFAAFAAATLWALHPLQTAAVTYVMQRSELLVTCCYLATLTAFARAGLCHPLDDKIPQFPEGTEISCHLMDDNLRPRFERAWLAISATACLLGMGCKEVMVTAPLAVLLYDRMFLSPSFFAALRARPRYYACLAASWLALAGLLLGTDNRGASAGFHAGVAWGDYALTQAFALALYLRLAAWPSPLVFDYGTALVTTPAALLLPGTLVIALLGGTLLALRRRPALGFAGALFLLLLAPTTSVVPIATQTIAEHRVYLALALPFAVAAFSLLRGRPPPARLAVVTLALVLGVATYARNTAYRSAVALWTDTVAKCPANARAHYNLAVALLVPGVARDPERAIAEFHAALRLEPAHPLAPGKLGATLLEVGRFAEAVAPLTSALRQQPANATLHYQLAGALLATGRLADAASHLAETLRLNPAHAAAHYNYARALTDLGRYEEALSHFETAARLDPTDASARTNAARLRDTLGR